MSPSASSLRSRELARQLRADLGLDEGHELPGLFSWELESRIGGGTKEQQASHLSAPVIADGGARLLPIRKGVGECQDAALEGVRLRERLTLSALWIV